MTVVQKSKASGHESYSSLVIGIVLTIVSVAFVVNTRTIQKYNVSPRHRYQTLNPKPV